MASLPLQTWEQFRRLLEVEVGPLDDANGEQSILHVLDSFGLLQIEALAADHGLAITERWSATYSFRQMYDDCVISDATRHL